MKALIVRNAAALLTLGAAVLSWNGTAHAQNNVVVQPTPQAAPVPPPAPTATPPANNNIVVAPGTSPGVAEPQPVEPVAVAPVPEGAVHPENRPNRTLLMTGLVLFGAPYVASIGIAASSPHSGDSNLYVPIVGPWIDLGQRPSCPATGSCGAETGDRVLLVGDGILQTIGALEIIGAFIFPETIPVAHVALDGGRTVAFTPSNVGSTGYGMTAVGQF
ncbi:MAG TPA: hypothetical protein VGL81_06435 [Polyangiaceae bacterium]|jgi:hypothetical protein